MTISPVGPQFGSVNPIHRAPMFGSLQQVAPRFGNATDTVTLQPKGGLSDERIRELCSGVAVSSLLNTDFEENIFKYKKEQLRKEEVDQLVDDLVTLAVMYGEYSSIIAADDATLGKGAAFYKGEATDYREQIEAKFKILTQNPNDAKDSFDKKLSLHYDALLIRVNTRLGHMRGIDPTIKNMIDAGSNPMHKE